MPENPPRGFFWSPYIPLVVSRISEGAEANRVLVYEDGAFHLREQLWDGTSDTDPFLMNPVEIPPVSSLMEEEFFKDDI